MSKPTTPNILIVDDEANLASALALMLERRGYQTKIAPDGQTALEILDKDSFDLVLLDLNLGDPLLDGLEVCRRIRARDSYLRVIMLTVRDSSTNKVTGLEMGANDYITKPFDPDELLARIRATLRPVMTTSTPPQESILRVDERLQIDATRRRVYRDGKEVALTRREFDLLLFLAKNPGQPFDRKTLLDKVWGWDYLEGADRTVDKHIAELRRKLEDDPANPTYILTVRGFGYTFKDWKMR